MDHTTSSERPRKRRAINACVNCRTSKVRCDGKRPCQRCERNDAVCQYHEAVRDESILRIEKLEAEVAILRHEMNNNIHQQSASAAISTSRFNENRILPNAVDAGLITVEQAASWYQRFCTRYPGLTIILMSAQLFFWQCTTLRIFVNGHSTETKCSNTSCLSSVKDMTPWRQSYPEAHSSSMG
jgi:uncharacterized Zn finger protein (UPF0148 family)